MHFLFTRLSYLIFLFPPLDSNTPASRNSANVTFHNLSGKDIVVSAKPDIENSTKEIELKAGSRATLKIDESSMDEPISFSAKWMKDSDKELLLNGNTTFKVTNIVRIIFHSITARAARQDSC